MPLGLWVGRCAVAVETEFALWVGGIRRDETGSGSLKQGMGIY